MTIPLTALPGNHRAVALVLLLATASLPLPVHSQSAASPLMPSPAQPLHGAQSPLRFEVASIRPHQSTGDEPSNRQILPGGRFVASATSVRTLLRIAFAPDSISATPNWVDEAFDINATTANHADVTTPQQFQQLILSLLQDRFQLKFHHEQKEMPVYWLELERPGKPGPALQLSAPDSQPNMSSNSNGSRTVMRVVNMSMTDIAAGLSRQADRSVEDHTGLKGNFDFRIEWDPEEAPNSDLPSLFTVLKEQLGLKLQPAKGTGQIIIIDQISHPTPN